MNLFNVLQVAAINEMSKSGVYFFDYGNAFLLQAKLAGADLEPTKEQKKEAKEMRIVREFRYPSYVQVTKNVCTSLPFGI